MDYIYIGVITNTHALKGELRILSDFEFKNKVFVKNFPLYIDKKDKLIINTHRPHKNYNMVTFNGVDSIAEALKYKGKKVYINKSDLNLNEDEILYADLIGMKCYYNNNLIGQIDNIVDQNGNVLIYIGDTILPYHNNFIDNISIEKKEIVLKNMEGLLK